MNRDEGVERVNAFAGIERLLALHAHGYRGVSCVWHSDWQFDQARDWLDVAYCQAYVFSPDIDYGSASAVVAGVHAQVILLMEPGLQGDDPIGTFFVGAALVGPECWSRRS